MFRRRAADLQAINMLKLLSRGLREKKAGKLRQVPIIGRLAQLGEHHVRNVGVEGSNPLPSIFPFQKI